MDICVSSKSKNEVTNSESRLKNVKLEEKNLKENSDFRQNNNAHLNQMSFIPVYTKKVDMCHYYSDKNDGNKSQSNVPTKSSPTSLSKCLIDQNDKMPMKSVRAQMRRRSVGFEDVTSLQSCYRTNDKRTEELAINSNVTGSCLTSSKGLNSDNDISYSYSQRNMRENSSMSSLNQNSKVVKNANDQMQDNTRLQHQYKDKSSKRKSSLNRMDFIDFPNAYSSNRLSKQSHSRSKNSSSDEEVDAKIKFSNEHSNSTKRKHNYSNSTTSAAKPHQTSANEISQTSSPTKPKALPKSLQSSHFKLKQHKRVHSTITQLQKLSHSAGELESLTDDTTTNSCHKICLSAQECDALDPQMSRSRTSAIKNFKKQSKLPPVSCSNSMMKNSNNLDASLEQSTKLTSMDNENNPNSSAELKISDKAHENVIVTKEDAGTCKEQTSLSLKDSNLDSDFVEPFFIRLNLNDSFELKHIDSKSEDDLDVVESTSMLHSLDIADERNFEALGPVSDESYDSGGSDSRPNSILKRNDREGRRKLHGILKPPPDDKLSKTLPSILKHRESSEEKDVWQQSDLHSILKKSASEDESCNSGLDIRPILKVSTDEDSPGSCSARPRPILKKRTSFSEECCYASYADSDLKPILKKKTPLLMDDQPRPILKSRRKSEDNRSSLSEFIASRPRAYSADMGVKPNHDGKLEGLEQKTDEFCKREIEHQ